MLRSSGGDQVFQYSQSVSNQQAVVVAMVGALQLRTIIEDTPQG